MKKQALVAALLLMLLFSALVGVQQGGLVSAQSFEAVIIQADGTVQGTSSIQRNGNVYTFVGSFIGPLYVQKDNIIIDGAGYTLTGGDGRGIVLEGRHEVTLKNTMITLDGGYIIDVGSATDCVLIGNTLIGTPEPISGLPSDSGSLVGPIAINFLHSQNITVKDNTITNFFRGLSLEWSSGHAITGNILDDGIAGIEICNTTGCVFRNNQISNSGFSIRTYQSYQYENDLDSSNTIDGKPIYYWINTEDRTVPSDAAYIVLVKCTNIRVENSSPHGVALVSTTNSVITKIKMVGRGDGINLLDCSGISVLENTLRDQAIGIDIQNSLNNTISGNDISNHATRGINLGNSNDNVISGNILTGNGYAIAPFQDTASNGNIIASNNFTKNDFALIVHGSMKIQNNIFEDNNVGILLSGGSNSTITQNMLANNNDALYISASSGNRIYLNNFLNNTRQVADAGATSPSTTAAKTSSYSIQLVAAHGSGVNFLPPPPPSINSWDNGAEGNYWSDYSGNDANGDGIGETAHYLYENNQDNYPLINPVMVSGASSPQEAQSTPTSDTQPETQPFPTALVTAITVVLVAVVSFGLAAYFVRRNRKRR